MNIIIKLQRHRFSKIVQRFSKFLQQCSKSNVKHWPISYQVCNRLSSQGQCEPHENPDWSILYIHFMKNVARTWKNTIPTCSLVGSRPNRSVLSRLINLSVSAMRANVSLNSFDSNVFDANVTQQQEKKKKL